MLQLETVEPSHGNNRASHVLGGNRLLQYKHAKLSVDIRTVGALATIPLTISNACQAGRGTSYRWEDLYVARRDRLSLIASGGSYRQEYGYSEGWVREIMRDGYFFMGDEGGGYWYRPSSVTTFLSSSNQGILRPRDLVSV